MKKQVTFAENLRLHGLHGLHDEALPRMNRSKTAALNDVAVNLDRPTAARRQPQLMRIPQTAVTTGPFLKHTALTPAQKEYLYTVAASSSPAHVRTLITQHYMSILHRRTRAGYGPDTDDLAAAAAAAAAEHVRDKRQITKRRQPDASFRLKHKEKTSGATRRSGKSFLPNITNGENRLSNAAASKRGKPRERETSSAPRSKSPRRARIMTMVEEDEEEPEEEEEEGRSG